MLREVKSLPRIAPGLLSGRPHLFSSTQVARFSGEELDQIISKVPFSIIIPPFYEATAQKFATNPERLPGIGEFRTRCEKERQASLVKESSVLCVSIKGVPNTYHPSFPPCSKKTKGKKDKWWQMGARNATFVANKGKRCRSSWLRGQTGLLDPRVRWP